MPTATWILIRGLSREAAHWGPFLPALAAAMPDDAIVTLDLPGTGTRLRERAPHTIGETVERIREEAASRVKREGPVFLFGISLGGMVAMEWAARHQDELAGVVVGASSAPNVAPAWKRMKPQGFALILLNALVRDSARRQARVARLVLNRRDLWDEAGRSWAQIERERPVTLATVRAQITAAGLWRAPRALPVPALFLVGRKDRLVHPDCTRRLARRYGAPLSEHPDAGHDLTTDAQEWVIDEMTRFQARVGEARAGTLTPPRRERKAG